VKYRGEADEARSLIGGKAHSLHYCDKVDFGLLFNYFSIFFKAGW
jgi:hypothetical protein